MFLLPHFQRVLHLYWVILVYHLLEQPSSFSKVWSSSSAVFHPAFLQILNSTVLLYSLQHKLPSFSTLLQTFISPSQPVSSRSHKATPLASLSSLCGSPTQLKSSLGALPEATSPSPLFSGLWRSPIPIGVCRWEIFSSCLEKASSLAFY